MLASSAIIRAMASSANALTALTSFASVTTAFRFSQTAQNVLLIARHHLPFKRQRGTELSSSGLLFAITELGAMDSHSPGFLREQLDNQRYTLEIDSYFSRLPSATELRSSPSQDFSIVTANAQRIIQHADSLARETGEGEIHARHIIGALLAEHPVVPVAHERLERCGANIDVLRGRFFEFLQGQRFDSAEMAVWRRTLSVSGSSGSAEPASSRIRREVIAEETGLKVDAYVQALRSVLANAQGETTIAVTGCWGRGKTVLANRLARSLESSGYATAWIDAWRHPSRPEIWAYIYEQIVRATDGPWWRSIPRRIRANLSRTGAYPIALALLSLAFAILPMTIKLQLAFQLAMGIAGAIGFIGTCWSTLAAMRTQGVVSRIWKQYTALSSHRDKLGLNAAIGRDLEHLLTGALPLGRDGRPLVSKMQVVAFGLGVGAFAGVVGVAFHGFGATWLAWLLPLAIVAVAAGLTAWVKRGGRQLKRLLIVVDDLDRCSPDMMLDVMEAIRLMVSEPVFSEHVQVLMLVDPEMMQSAIRERYKGRTRRGISEVIREHAEKLFLTQFRLPELNDGDIDELYVRYVEQKMLRLAERLADLKERKIGLSKHGHNGNLASGESAVQANDLDKEIGQISAQIESSTAAPVHVATSNGKIIFGIQDQEALKSAFEIIKKPRRMPIRPRTIRTLLARYQIACVLGEASNVRVDRGEIARRLAESACGASERLADSDTEWLLEHVLDCDGEAAEERAPAEAPQGAAL